MDTFVIIFEGKKYAVPKNTPEVNQIILPNGSVIKALTWLTFDESDPQPIGLHENTLIEVVGLPEEVAKKINAVIATPV